MGNMKCVLLFGRRLLALFPPWRGRGGGGRGRNVTLCKLIINVS